MTLHRITPDDVDAAILAVQYHVFPGTTKTVCCVTLQNGYSVTGESACADPALFNAEIGQEWALVDAKKKIWPLLGFALRSKLHQCTKETV